MTDGGEERALPAAVRHQLISIAADVIGKRPVTELPPAVRRFARFAPAKRIRLGAAEIATALAVDDGFRDAVAEVVTEASPELVEQVNGGTPPATADPVDVAVIAYLTRPDRWRQLIADAADSLTEETERRTTDAEVQRLRSEVERLGIANAEMAKARDDARETASTVGADQAKQVAELQHRIRTMQGDLRAAQRAEQQAAGAVTEVRAELDRLVATQSSELRKMRARIAALETELDTGRRTVRTERDQDDVRLWLLLEQISAAASGLRRELDLSRPTVSPADSVQTADASTTARPSMLDGSMLDRVLDGSHVHLIVDGYNLTKTGYGELPLVDQRARLVSSLGALAARTKVEVTVAFDGTAAPAGSAASLPTPRGVRVLFSAVGQLADDLIRDLLRAEPDGRTVVVASSDQAVAASARGAGAWPTSAAALLSRVERG
jgi:predicted RNA-binding protein with PIN domain